MRRLSASHCSPRSPWRRPPPAGPLDDYRRNGSIDPCRYSDQQLRNGLNGLPPDVQQYAPGLTDQLSAGREGCGGGGARIVGHARSSSPCPAPPIARAEARRAAAPPPRPRCPHRRRPRSRAALRLADLETPAVTAGGSDAPGWLAPLLRGRGPDRRLVALLRLRGVSFERVARPLRASFADAGGRTADAFAEIWDSVRLGR